MLMLNGREGGGAGEGFWGEMVVYWALWRRLGKVSRPEKRWKLSAGQLVVRTAPARRNLTRRSAHVPSRSSGARTRRFPLHPAWFRLHARWFPLPAAAATVSPGPGSGYPWPGFRFTVPVTPWHGSRYSLHPRGQYCCPQAGPLRRTWRS